MSCQQLGGRAGEGGAQLIEGQGREAQLIEGQGREAQLKDS